jgi:glycogen operon protein
MQQAHKTSPVAPLFPSGPFTISCGQCWFCTKGLFSACERTNPYAAVAAKAMGHSPAGLRRNRFLTGTYDEELDVKELTWINASGVEMSGSDWEDKHMRCFGMLIDGRAQPTGIRQRGTEATLLLVLNAHHDLVEFTLPQQGGGPSWSLLVDTNLPDDEQALVFASTDRYGVTARSLLLFAMT